MFSRHPFFVACEFKARFVYLWYTNLRGEPMPKGSHFHVNHDGMNTDKKFRPEDEGIYQEEKHEFQSSETAKKEEAEAVESSTPDQDESSDK